MFPFVIDIDAIIDNRLFLGNLLAAKSTKTLSDRSITHILSACLDDTVPYDDPNLIFTRLQVPIQDSYHADLLIHLPRACKFIDDALENGGNVLVHCYAGISRSATVVAAYLMWKRHITPEQALKEIRAVRGQIEPNQNFMEQLTVFEDCQYAPSLDNEIYVHWRDQVFKSVCTNEYLRCWECANRTRDTD